MELTAVKWYNGSDVTACEIVDIGISVGLIAAGGLAIISAPAVLVTMGNLGVLDSIGAFDQIKSSLGGRSVVFQGYKPGN